MQFSAECCISSVHFWNKKYSNIYVNESNKEQIQNVFFERHEQVSNILTKIDSLKIFESQLIRFGGHTNNTAELNEYICSAKVIAIHRKL